MEDFELFPDEEEEAATEEGSNRTFIILVAVFGGILAIGICAFIVWAVVIYPQIQRATASNADVEQTAIVLTSEAEIAADMVESTETPEPTETPPPPPPTQEPTKVPPTATATPAEVAEAGTEEPTATRRPTVTPKPTATSGGDEVPTTGVGAFGAGGIVVALMVILVAARRLRRAA
jgi:cytoskeletal protein RodZ